MTYNLDLRKTLMEIPHIVGHRLQLRRGARVLGMLHILGAATGIHHMTAHTVVALGTIGHFPRIDLRIFVVINKAFHLAIQVYQVGIAYLLPATTPLLTGSVCQWRISLEVTSRPSGVAVQCRTKYFILAMVTLQLCIRWSSRHLRLPSWAYR